MNYFKICVRLRSPTANGNCKVPPPPRSKQLPHEKMKYRAPMAKSEQVTVCRRRSYFLLRCSILVVAATITFLNRSR